MSDWIGGLVQESQDQYRMAWELIARSRKDGVVEKAGNLSFSIAGIPFPMFNVAFPDRPPQSIEELLQLKDQALRKFSEHQVEGMLTLPSSWIPRGGIAALEDAGMKQDFKVMGMRTARLNDLVRPVPEIRHVHGDEATELIARVNAAAYGIPKELESVIRLPGVWQGDVRAYAVFENQDPVAVGASVIQNGICYIMWMATVEKARGKGYAQAIVCRAWNDAREKDLARMTVLHATQMGRPVYHKLGYTAIAEFPGFISTAG